MARLPARPGPVDPVPWKRSPRFFACVRSGWFLRAADFGDGTSKHEGVWRTHVRRRDNCRRVIGCEKCCRLTAKRPVVSSRSWASEEREISSLLQRVKATTEAEDPYVNAHLPEPGIAKPVRRPCPTRPSRKSARVTPGRRKSTSNPIQADQSAMPSAVRTNPLNAPALGNPQPCPSQAPATGQSPVHSNLAHRSNAIHPVFGASTISRWVCSLLAVPQPKPMPFDGRPSLPIIAWNTHPSAEAALVIFSAGPGRSAPFACAE